MLRTSQRLHRRLLGDGAGGGGGLTLHRHDPLDHVGPGGGIADSPAGHGVGLGKAVHCDRPVLDLLRDGRHTEMLRSVIDQLLIDLVGHDEEIVRHSQRRQLSQALLTVYRPRGVVGGADDDGLGSGGDGLLDGVQIQLIVVLPHWDEHRCRTGQTDHFGIAYPAGDGQQHLITGARDHHHRTGDGLLGAHRRGHLVQRILYAVVLFQLLHDLLTQLQDPVAGGILGKVVRDGLHASYFDVVGGPKIGLPHVQGNNVLSLALQFRHLGDQRRGG